MTTFTREQLATLREAAEAAKEKTTWQNLQAFRAAATPEVVLALLDVLDASLEAEPLVPVMYKGMKLLTKEGLELIRDGIAEATGLEAMCMAKALLSAPPVRLLDGLEAEPVAWKVTFTQVDQESNTFTAIYFDKAEVEHWVRLHKACDFQADITPLYAAPVVPEEISTTHTMLPAMNDQLMALGYVKGWNACRAAMLKEKGE